MGASLLNKCFLGRGFEFIGSGKIFENKLATSPVHVHDFLTRHFFKHVCKICHFHSRFHYSVNFTAKIFIQKIYKDSCYFVETSGT